MSQKHAWRFFRSGGFDQVRLDSGADLFALEHLDQKLWVALSCPTRGVELDPATLDLVDTDKDGRIRPPEIKAAVAWACARLRNPDELIQHSANLPLTAIKDDTPEGKQLLASAHQILRSLGKPDATSISVDDTSNTAGIFAGTTANGDGIVQPESAGDETTRAAIRDVMACLGGETDRSGKPGVSQAKTEQFFAELRAYAEWRQKAEGDEAILPFGEATLPAVAALTAVKAKIEDYFGRCRLGAYDERAVAALNREEKEYLAIAAKDLTITASEVAGFPLARVVAGGALPLQAGINPAWSDAIAAFRSVVVKPLLGERESLSEAEWSEIKGKLGPCEGWLACKAGGSVERLGLARVRELLAGKAAEGVATLIAKDKAYEAEANAIRAVDKLVRYYRDLHTLLVNYVNFRDFYDRKAKAIFQAGRLYLDQRSCDLCLTVEDAGKHAAMAGLAGACLVYCDCARKSTGGKMQIVAAMTDGDSDNLMVGRNGIFYDRKGQDWDATIVKIVENPISLRQAFWSPYKKFVRMIEEQVAKRAGAAEVKAHANLESTAAAVTTADKAKPAEPKKFDVGTIAALGVGLGAIATVVGGFVAGFLSMAWWQMPLALAGLMIVVSLPSVLIAALKLRKRNLGPVLDANGWAVNAKAKINIPFGRSLTRMAALPPGSSRNLVDPYAEKKAARNTVIAVAVVAAVVFALWRYGVVERLAPGILPKSGWMKAREAAAATAAPATPAPEPPAK